jgi:hypothetical protein
MRTRLFLAVVAVLSIPSMAFSQSFPHKLNIGSLSQWNQVREAGSDARSEAFSKNMVPKVMEIASNLLESGKVFGDRHKFRLDQDKLYTSSRTPYPVRVYFIAEGAGYQNSIGLSLNYAGATSGGDMRLVLPNASMPVQGTDYRSGNFGTRRSDAPLLPGDYAEIGEIPAGVQLDFFIVQDGNRVRDAWVFGNRDEQNPDRFQHVMSYVIPDSPFLLIGFEDLWNGGDMDYEDVLIVVDLGKENVENLVDASKLPN